MKDFQAKLFGVTCYGIEEKEEQVKVFLKKAKWAAYIKHDKDDKETHWHIVIEYETRRHAENIKNGIQEITKQNCFLEKGRSKKALVEYLTHKNDPEKFQYEEGEIIWINKNKYETNVEMEIVQAIVEGKEEWELLREFGREYIRNRRAYRESAEVVKYDRWLKEVKEKRKEHAQEIKQLMIEIEEKPKWNSFTKRKR